jgi:hypothetical protein
MIEESSTDSYIFFSNDHSQVIVKITIQFHRKYFHQKTIKRSPINGKYY